MHALSPFQLGRCFRVDFIYRRVFVMFLSRFVFHRTNEKAQQTNGILILGPPGLLIYYIYTLVPPHVPSYNKETASFGYVPPL